MTLDVSFWVSGEPVPKGNHDGYPIARGRCTECKPGLKCRRRNCFGGTIVGTVVTDDAGDKLKTWEQVVRVHAMSARNRAGERIVPRPHALEVQLAFVFERPAGHWTTKGHLSAEGLRQAMPSVKPDWDKVSRAVADGLTGALVEDDAQIVVASVAKVYGPREGVAVRARQIAVVTSWVTELLGAVGVTVPTSTQGSMF